MRWISLLAGLAVLGLVVGESRLDAQSTLGAPTIVSVGPGTGMLTVLWNAPSDNGGSTITAYYLRYIPTDDDETVDANWTEKQDAIWETGGGALSYQVLDLEDGVGFDVQVRAVNANGDGPWSATSTGTTTDHGGTTATATDLAFGSSIAGHLTPVTDEDVFEIIVAAEGEVWIYATGPLDTVAELLNSGGDILEESDDGTHLDGPLGFEFRETLDAGTYYVRVSSYEDRATGSYRIHAQTFTDPGSTFETATDITLDSATPGRIGPRGGRPTANPAGDADYFKLVLTATTDVWVMAYGTLGGDEDEALDTEGFLYDASQNQLLYADDSEFLDNDVGFMFRRSLAAGTYYIRVNGFFAEDVGPYTLHVRTATEPGSTAATATPLTLRIPETGRITSSSDRDYFSLTLAEDRYVFIYAVTFGSSQPLTPTFLDDQNTEVSMHVIPNENWSEQGVEKISFSAWGKLDAGTYTIRIAGSSGNYLLDPLLSTYNRMLEDCTAITTTQSDPWYGCQWHLNNTDEFDDSAGEDINVESVWTGGNMGAGINVAIVDDGIEADHVDLVDNVIAARNHDFTGQGGVYDPLETHGTAVAGLVAARDNDIGVRGVAPRASIFAYNVIARGSSVSANEASAMYKSEDAAVTAVSNNSWGASPTGLPISSRSTWQRAVTRGVTEGYGGKGIVYVLSGGNGHEDERNDSNLDGRANYYAVIAACAVAYDDKRSDYSELGANLWVCAPSNSGRGLQGITTTHIPDRYRDNFGGTSAAAPIVSGVVALIRAANADLTWRDVKLILAASARKNDATNADWDEGALQYGSTTDRYDFNHEYGFGMVDAAAAVALADGWTNVPQTLRTSQASSGQLGDANFRGVFLPDRDGNTVTETQFTRSLDNYVSFIEFVEIEIEFRHDYFRDLRIELESPSGEVSVLSVPALAAGQEHFYDSHRFGSAKHLGESAEGTWTLKVGDYQTGDTGRLMSWRLKVYGHSQNPGYVDIDDVRSGPGEATVTWKEVDDIGGSAITSYDLRYKKLGDSDWTEVTDVGALDNRTYRLTGLDGSVGGVSVWYQLQMRAVNDAGPGPWSDSSNVAPWRVAPDAPRSVSTAARNEALAVSWRTPNYWGAQPLVAYHIRYIEADATDKSDSEWTTVSRAWQTGGGELRYVIRGLTNGTAYEVQVQAENIRTTGGWSGVATGTPANINGPAEFAGTRTTRGIPENAPAGADIGDPVSARDDEGDTLTYSLRRGTNILEINSATGQLQTKFAFDHELAFRYFATVAVHDGKASDGTENTGIDDTIDVTIDIEDVDEPPVVAGSATRRVWENSTAVATYTASDPERATTTFTWSLAGDDATAFAISDRGVLTFDPAPNYEVPTDTGHDNTYNVTIRATGDSATEAAAMTGEIEVEVTVQDVDEPPEIAGTETITIAENSGAFVGSYTATDPEGTDTTWLTLQGADARYFTLDEFGTLSFVETPDFDRATNGNHAPEYRVTLRASDEGNRTRSHPVTITLTNVNEGPFIEGDTVIEVNEGHTATLDTYTKRDPEGSSSNWAAVGQTAALTGADAGRLEFDKANGRLTFADPPDFESGGASYEVTLNANDGTLNSTLDITVNVANLEESGEVVLGGRRGVINVPLQATLTDPDNVVSSTWQWQRSTSRSSGWSDIANADTSSYTPTADDRNQYLRATASYEDGHGPGKSANAVTEFTTVNERATNTPPTLPDSVDDISIPENTRAGRNVGSAIRATDAENDPLLYTLSGSSDFTIHQTSARIRVADDVTLDFDVGQTAYSLTVTADDGFGGTDTVDVTINITGVNEPPDATDDAPSSFNEDTSLTIDVLANDTDPEDNPSTLTLSIQRRPANGTVMVNQPQNPGDLPTITYTPRANYNGSDSFTYRARDPGNLNSNVATVALTIRAVNDDPAFSAATAERSVSESAEEGDNVGAPLTASDIDGDDLIYSLSGTDAFAFDIDRDSGQITVGTGTTFDIATQDTYAVTVTADDGNGGRASIDVTITVTSGPVGPVIFIGGGGGGGGSSGPTPSEVDFEWTVKRDIEELDAGHDTPSGMWSDGSVLFLAENGDGADDAVYVYDVSSGERVEGREFALAETNRAPRGIWSSGKTAWVSDSGRERLFAYDLETGERDEEREIGLAPRNRDARGIWSDGATMWVLNRNPSLFAYDLATGELLAQYALDSRNSDPRGAWSDGVTIWISDDGLKELWAYRLPVPPGAPEPSNEETALERVRDEDFTDLSSSSNNSPRGIWSDGEYMYVADESDDKVYSYNIPDAIDARLATLTLSGVEIGEFDPATPDYEGTVGEGVTRTTVVASAVQRRTEVTIDPPDADAEAEGHQVALAGTSAIAITVTSADGKRKRTYRVAFEPAVTVVTVTPAWTAIEWPGADGAAIADALPAGVAAVYTWDEAAKTWLAYFPALTEVPDINTLTSFATGETYWIAVSEAVTWLIPTLRPSPVPEPVGEVP